MKNPFEKAFLNLRRALRAAHEHNDLAAASGGEQQTHVSIPLEEAVIIIRRVERRSSRLAASRHLNRQRRAQEAANPSPEPTYGPPTAPPGDDPCPPLPPEPPSPPAT